MSQKGQHQLTKSTSEAFKSVVSTFTSSESSHRYLLIDKTDKTAIPFKRKVDIHKYTEPSEASKTKKKRTEEMHKTKRKTYFVRGIIDQIFEGFKKLRGY